MAMPKRERTARKAGKVVTKPLPSSRRAQRRRLAISGHLRPKRSEMTPKRTAPTERKRSVSVMEDVWRVVSGCESASGDQTDDGGGALVEAVLEEGDGERDGEEVDGVARPRKPSENDRSSSA
jgi:hypothetical protein